MSTLDISLRASAPIPLEAEFRVAPGELLALVGPSGAGKTTLLRTIAGLWRPEAGRVAVGATVWLDTAAGIDLPPYRRRVGVAFQSYALFPHMTAAENVMAAMDADTPRDRRAEAARLLALVGLDALAARQPAQLSGGQRQRVALARALARRPQALLLDEPFSAVDRAARERLHAALLGLRAHLAMPVVLVTHDLAEAQMLADRVAVIETGRLLREGPMAEVMADPAALRAMGLREVAALLPAWVAAQEPDGLTRLETAAGPIWLPRIEAAPGTPVHLRIPAHEVIVARDRPQGLSAQNILPAQVRALVPGDGPGVMVHLDIGGHEILARLTLRAARMLDLAPGAQVHAVFKTMAVARRQVRIGPAPARPDATS